MNLSSGMSADKSADASADVLGRISYFGPNFRKWSEFGLFCKYQSEFGPNLLRKSEFFNF